jgi:hypothetical protein
MYPISYRADFNPRPNRWTTFFRILLAIPWLIVAMFWGLLFVFTHFFAWIALVVMGRYPEWLYKFNSGVLRFGVRVSAWVYLQTDVWPPFGLDDDRDYPIRLEIAPRAERQSRLKAFFRLILALPVALVLSYGTSYIQLLAGLVAWVTIVFRGYMPEGIHNMLTFVNAFHARVLGYIALLTDDYPPIGLEAARPSGRQPAAGEQFGTPPPAPAA